MGTSKNKVQPDDEELESNCQETQDENNEEGVVVRESENQFSQEEHKNETGILLKSDYEKEKWGGGLCQINPVTKTGQRLYMVHMLLLPFLPITALIIQNSTTLNDLLQYQSEVQRIGTKVAAATLLEKFITNMQRERSEVAFHIFTNGTQTLGRNLSERFMITDSAFEKMPWPNIKTTDNTQMFKSKLRYQIRHGDFRQRISQDEEDIQSVLDWYNSVDAVFLDHLSQDIKGTNSSAVWRYLIAYKNLLRSIENIGIAVVYGIRYYGQGNITQDQYIQFIRHDTLGFEYLDQSKNFAPQVRKDYDLIKRKTNFTIIEASRDDVLAQKRKDPDPKEAFRYYQATFEYTENLRNVLTDLRLRLVGTVKSELKAANQQQALGIAILLLVLIISPIIIFLVRNATATIHIFSLTLSTKEQELTQEKQKMEDLLYLTLPYPVARDIQLKKRVNAEKFEAVTIYYSDLVEFTDLYSESTPVEMVIMLNAYYKMFDDSMKKYRVYKVNSVNDSHMIVSGLPPTEGQGDQHATQIARMALNLMGNASRFVIAHRPYERLKLRAGINTGPVIAGVQAVGSKMPRYRLFGDTVKFAALLNCTGESQKIHISMETKILLDSLGGYFIEPRGLLVVDQSNGRDQKETFWLTGKEDGMYEPDDKIDLSEGPEYMRRLPDYLQLEDP